MADVMLQEPKKASFFESMTSGIGGFIKGALAGGTIGALAGAAIGAVAGLFAGGIGALAGAIAGAEIGGAVMGSIGALAGTTTSVVQSREKGQVSAQDVVNVATISYAQGMGVGHSIGQEQAAHEAQSHFRDKIMKERAARGQSQQQVH